MIDLDKDYRIQAICIVFSTLYILRLLRGLVLPPSSFPKNIPTVPFYVSFLGAYTKLDQRDIFERYLREHLERYGAVKIYFASRWNILATKPEYLTQIFKYEQIFAKSGNQKKIPNSVLADYTGDNIISAHGETWKLYRKIMTQGIQFPELSHTWSNVEKLRKMLYDEVEQGRPDVNISQVVQKFCLANIGDTMLGTDFATMESEPSELHGRLLKVKSQIFKPLFLNFPSLDNLPIPSRQRARREVANFRNFFCGKVKTSQSKMEHSRTPGGSLYKSLETNEINERQFADNAVILMVAGHENPQLLITSLLYVLAKYQYIQANVRDECANVVATGGEPETPYLDSVMYETLRLYPPLGQIINRLTTMPVTLGRSISIPKNVYVGYNNFATGRDRTVWGPDADFFRPERWGKSNSEIKRNYLVAKSSCRLPAFHGRKRACLGERFALYESKLAIIAIVSSFQFRLSRDWAEKLTPAGPVSPLALKLHFSGLAKDVNQEKQPQAL